VGFPLSSSALTRRLTGFVGTRRKRRIPSTCRTSAKNSVCLEGQLGRVTGSGALLCPTLKLATAARMRARFQRAYDSGARPLDPARARLDLRAAAPAPRLPQPGPSSLGDRGALRQPVIRKTRRLRRQLIIRLHAIITLGLS
jgi:hypothetical protein